MTTRFEADKMHAEIGFSAKHMMVSTVRGRFEDFDAWLEVDGTDHTTARGEAVIKTASVSTGAQQRDDHLRSADFFESEKYPEMRFVLSSVQKKDDSNYVARGDLTIREITRPVELSVEVGGPINDPWGNERLSLSVNGKINRKDWDLTWNQVLEAGAVLVGETIKLNAEVAMVRPAAVLV
jgi:polyisoprenoid-binding protein YceI